MKVVFTIVKKHIKDKQIIGVTTEELVSENVCSFNFDEARQLITVKYNGEPETIINLMPEGQQWFFLEAKCFQVPLKVKL